MEVEVELTTNHWGWFEFKLCPVNDKTRKETQKCMDKYPLHLVDDPKSTKFWIPENSKKKDIFTYKVQLPPNVVCSQCVVQWTYRTGKRSFIYVTVPLIAALDLRLLLNRGHRN